MRADSLKAHHLPPAEDALPFFSAANVDLSCVEREKVYWISLLKRSARLSCKQKIMDQLIALNSEEFNLWQSWRSEIATPFCKLNITSRSSSRLIVRESGHGEAIHLVIGRPTWEVMFLRMTWFSENVHRPWSLTVASISRGDATGASFTHIFLV